MGLDTAVKKALKSTPSANSVDSFTGPVLPGPVAASVSAVQTPCALIADATLYLYRLHPNKPRVSGSFTPAVTPRTMLDSFVQRLIGRASVLPRLMGDRRVIILVVDKHYIPLPEKEATRAKRNMNREPFEWDDHAIDIDEELPTTLDALRSTDYVRRLWRAVHDAAVRPGWGDLMGDRTLILDLPHACVVLSHGRCDVMPPSNDVCEADVGQVWWARLLTAHKSVSDAQLSARREMTDLVSAWRGQVRPVLLSFDSDMLPLTLLNVVWYWRNSATCVERRQAPPAPAAPPASGTDRPRAGVLGARLASDADADDDDDDADAPGSEQGDRHKRTCVGQHHASPAPAAPPAVGADRPGTGALTTRPARVSDLAASDPFHPVVASMFRPDETPFIFDAIDYVNRVIMRGADRLTDAEREARVVAFAAVLCAKGCDFVKAVPGVKMAVVMTEIGAHPSIVDGIARRTARGWEINRRALVRMLGDDVLRTRGSGDLTSADATPWANGMRFVLMYWSTLWTSAAVNEALYAQ